MLHKCRPQAMIRNSSHIIKASKKVSQDAKNAQIIHITRNSILKTKQNQLTKQDNL